MSKLSSVDRNKFDKKSWVTQALNQFNRIVGNSDFPCLFGKKALRAESVFISICNFISKSEYADLKLILEEYTSFVKLSSIKERVLSPLVIFFDPKFNIMCKNAHQIGWEALNWIHSQDNTSWPKCIPINPDDPRWSFCFNGVPLFINMSTNEHKILKSRNLGHNLTFVINPRENFDFVASVKTKSGKLIRDKIRTRVVNFNNSPISDDLGFYGDDSNLEWKQYQLEEVGLARPSLCPFKSNKRGK